MDKQQLEEITGEFCDKYCKYPLVCTKQEQLDTVCEGCPMNELLDLKECYQ